MKKKLQLALLMVVSLTLLLCCPFWGLSVISPLQLLDPGSPDTIVFWRLRLPRTAAAFLAGAGLAVSGMVFQAMFRNALATPFTLGVSSGAAFGAALYVHLGMTMGILGTAGSLPAALAGAFLSMLLVYWLTRARGGFSTPVMLLAGVIVNFFFSSLVLCLQYLGNANDALRILHWLMGSLAVLETARIVDLTFVVIVGSLCLMRLTPELDLLTAGEELAASRGVMVARAKLLAFTISSAMVGTIVSLAGPIGFVGMMIPHICRLWFGAAHRPLLPATFFLGGAFLVLCDLFARFTLAPAEMPIGIITALIGGPFFLWTLFRASRNRDFF